MKEEEILNKAIEKAAKNGYIPPQKVVTVHPFYQYIDMHYIPGEFMSSESIVFSHDFAKAFWGEDYLCICGTRCKADDYVKHICSYEYGGQARLEWQHHLQQMVISETPIQYLKQFIE